MDNEIMERDNAQTTDENKRKKHGVRDIIGWIINILLTAVFILVCTFSLYRRYDEPHIFEKPAAADENQQKIDPQKDDNQKKTDDSSAPKDDDKQVTPDQTDTSDEESKAETNGHFTVYSAGDVYTAENGSGKLHCDVRNVEDSTHDIVMSLYISEDELIAHGLSTNGVEDGKWLIAQSGLFEPGYMIGEVQLKTLPDGSYLPAGSYSLNMSERFYDHETGVLSPYDANIPVTLEVAN